MPRYINFRLSFVPDFPLFVGTGRRNRSKRHCREKSDRPEIAEMKARMKQASEASLKSYNGDQTNTSHRTTEDGDSELHSYCAFANRFPKHRRGR